MTRRIPITNITPSTGLAPGTVHLGVTSENPTGDWTAVFRGRFYRQRVAPFVVTEFYTSANPPAGYQVIEATQFDLIENASYSGRYSVFTPIDATPERTYAGGVTTIKVNEPISNPIAIGDLTTGFVTNVSTFYIVIPNGAAVVIPPATSNSTYELDLPGRNFAGYGEALDQNLVNLFSHFASATAPAAPVQGTLWFNPTDGGLRVWDGAWSIVNANFFGPRLSYRHTQASTSVTWVVAHNLNSPLGIVNASFFVDVGGTLKPILPSDVTYDSVNQLTVTFTAPYSGYALVRP